MDTQVSGVNNWLTINGNPLNFEQGTENQALEIGEYRENTIRLTSHGPDDTVIFIDDQKLETAIRGVWTWNTKHYAGLYQISVKASNHPEHITFIRVYPHKFTQHIYEKMKSDLSKIAIDLLFELNSPALEKVDYSLRSEETSAFHDYKQIKLIIERMKDILSCIRRKPYATLQSHSIPQQLQEISHFSSDVMPLPGAKINLRPNQTGQIHLPQHWMVPVSNLSYDNHENRLLKLFLRDQLVTKLNNIQERAEKEQKRAEDVFARYHNKEDEGKVQKLKHVIRDCQTMKQRCISWSNERFLEKVQVTTLASHATQPLLKNPHYNRFYQLYLQFQQRLQTTINTDKYITALALHRVSTLYEMWSVFNITQIIIAELLKVGYRMISNTTFYQVERTYFQFDVHRNEASIILAKEDNRVEFKYEPIYPNQSTVINRSALVNTNYGNNPLTPDMAIEVYKNEVPLYILIFDAKYRWKKEANGIYPKQEDMNKMNTYYNSIQYKKYNTTLRKSSLEDVVSSAYIFFPGSKIHTQNKGKIGALPFTPNMAENHLKEVKEKLKDLLYYAYLLDE
ncbi:DUF2357 domain-containing protein [Dictyobacter formicarum]|uniref:DUF2357 domain-containing protein n=1 Tax=Dictyobacter formicarum TaxID=2778368 RepID=A0ABQ3V9D6_9CHLR|nr:DUF2357 domain-containing protein [Dictyobacter formicarum]GHO82283.1 hypothetical protein KSZ_02890 [Dictyobacter formicarum]